MAWAWSRKFHHHDFSAGPLFRNIAHVFWFDGKTAAVFWSCGHLFFMAYIINVSRANWYFEVTKVIDQEIPNYVPHNVCLKNAKGNRNYLILSPLRLWCGSPDQIFSVLIIRKQDENNYFSCFKLDLLSQIPSWSVHRKPPWLGQSVTISFSLNKYFR